MKKHMIISILMIIFSLSSYAGGCGSVSDVSGAEVSEPTIPDTSIVAPKPADEGGIQ